MFFLDSEDFDGEHGQWRQLLKIKLIRAEEPVASGTLSLDEERVSAARLFLVILFLNDSPPALPANEVAYTPPTDATVIPPYTPTKMPLPSNAPPTTSSSSRSPTRVPSSREEPVLAPSQRLTPPTPSCPLTDLDFQNMNNRSNLVITSPSRALSSTRSHRGLRESM